LEGELYIPESRKIKAVYNNDYSYQLDDVNEDPCVTKFKAYTDMLSIGIFTVLYAVGLAVFLSTTPIPGCTCNCKKKSVIDNQKVIVIRFNKVNALIYTVTIVFTFVSNSAFKFNISIDRF
jgi:hypothetical protein